MKNLRLGACALGLFTLLGCGQEIQPGNTPAEAPVVRGIRLLTVKTSELPSSQVFVGTLESPDRGLVASRIDGRVAHIAVKEGDEVRAGQLLLSLSDTTAPDQSKAAASALAEARGGLDAARARLDLAEKTHARYLALFAKEAVTAQEMDRVSAERQMALKGVEAAQAAAGRVSSLRDAAAVAAGYTRVSAPYDGTVVRRQVQEGSTVMPGTPLFVLDKKGELQVRAQFPEALIGKVAVGDVYALEVPSLDKKLSARVSDVLASADAVSRSFEVKLVPSEQQGLVSGLFVRLNSSAALGSPALLIPAAALLERGQLQGVYVVRDGLLHFRLVKTGRLHGEQIEILSGLNPGETIVTGGLEQAVAGARVEG